MKVLAAFLCLVIALPTQGAMNIPASPTNSRIAVTNMGSWNPSAFTFTAWINPTSVTDINGHNLFTKANSSSPFQRFAALIQNTPRIRVTRTGTASLLYDFNQDFTIGSWQFVALVYNHGAGTGAKAVMYRGTLTTAPTALGIIGTPTEGSGYHDISSYVAAIGNSSDGATSDAPLTGSIARVKVFDAALSAGEIATVWRGRSGRAHKGYWELYTSTVVDWSGNGYAGTVTGATQVDHVPLGAPFARAWQWLLAKAYAHLDLEALWQL